MSTKELVKQAVEEMRRSEIPSDPRMRAVAALSALGECPAPHRGGRHEVYTDSRGAYCRACGTADIQPEIPVTLAEEL